MSLLKLSNINKVYKQGDYEFKALDDVNLEVKKGEMIAIMGPSGAGKSTLLNIIGCMDIASSGDYYLNDLNTKNLKNRKLADIRNKYIGFIFQYFALMNDYSVLDNVQLPLTFRKLSKKKIKEISVTYLDKLGIKDQMNKRPWQLSGGQQQRVAIARALVTDCPLILADEPTGALDEKTGNDIMALLKEINKQGKTIIIVTHNIDVANQCDRKIVIKDGKIVEDTKIAV